MGDLFRVALKISHSAGSLVSMLAALQKENSFVAEHMEKLEHFIRSRKIGMGLAARMRTYYHYALMHSTDSDDVSLITGLSYSLRCVHQLLLCATAASWGATRTCWI